ncbi:MAG: ABC transporter permease [Bacilli bacterium]|nr:ABC transporter permease [Bacilli bacterium]
MDSKGRKILIKSHLFENRNILFFMINFFIILVILILMFTLYFSITYKILSYSNDVSFRTVEVSKKEDDNIPLPYDFSFLDNFDSISFHVDKRYDEMEFALKNYSDVSVKLKPLLEPSEINTNKELSQNEAICSKNFMIYSNENSVKYIRPKDLQFEDFSLNLLGVYNTRDNMSSLNTCYISKSTYESLLQSEQSYEEIVRLNNITDVKNFRSQMAKKGLSTYVKKQNNGNINLFIITTVFIISIVLIISFTIIFNFIKKKSIYRLKRYGLLKAVGYKNIDIVSLELREDVIIFICAFIASTIPLALLYNYTISHIFMEFVNESLMTVNMPILAILISFILVISFIIYIVKSVLKKILKQDISTILEGD